MAQINATAKFVCETPVTDPDTGSIVHIAVYKQSNGGMFAIDSSYLDQIIDDENGIIPNIFEEESEFYTELLD